jgi:hypothetical protein
MGINPETVPSEPDSANSTIVENLETTPIDDTFAALCRAADEKQRRKPPDPDLERLRTLMDDDVSLDRAWRELNRPSSAPEATLRAAEFLVQHGDAERFRAWLDRHSAEERAAIRKHLEAKRCR